MPVYDAVWVVLLKRHFDWCTARLWSEIWIGKEILSLSHTIRQLFTWPPSPMAWFRNSFPASATLCLPNTTKTKNIAFFFTMLWLNISNRICKVSSALYIDIRIDCLRRAVALIGLFAIIRIFVVSFVLCAFYSIFSIHAIHCISFSLSAQFLNKLELSWVDWLTSSEEQ